MDNAVMMTVVMTCAVLSTGFLYICASNIATIRKTVVQQAETVKVMAWRIQQMEAAQKGGPVH